MVGWERLTSRVRPDTSPDANWENGGCDDVFLWVRRFAEVGYFDNTLAPSRPPFRNHHGTVDGHTEKVQMLISKSWAR